MTNKRKDTIRGSRVAVTPSSSRPGDGQSLRNGGSGDTGPNPSRPKCTCGREFGTLRGLRVHAFRMKHDLTTLLSSEGGGHSVKALECPVVGPLGLGRGATTHVPEVALGAEASAAVHECVVMPEGMGSPLGTSGRTESVPSGSVMTAKDEHESQRGSARVGAVALPGKKNPKRKVTFETSPSVAVTERRAHRMVLRPKRDGTVCVAAEQANRFVCLEESRRREGRPPSADSTTRGAVEKAAEAEIRFPTRIFRAKRGAAAPGDGIKGMATPYCGTDARKLSNADATGQMLKDVMPRTEDSSAQKKQPKVMAEPVGAAGVGRPTNSSGPDVELLTRLTNREGVMSRETGTPGHGPMEWPGLPGVRTMIESPGILPTGTQDSMEVRGGPDGKGLMPKKRCEEFAEVAAGSSIFFIPPTGEDVGDEGAGRNGSGAQGKRPKVMAKLIRAAGLGRPTDSSGPDVKLSTRRTKRKGVMTRETGTPGLGPTDRPALPGVRIGIGSPGSPLTGIQDVVEERGGPDDKGRMPKKRCEEFAELAASSSIFFIPPTGEDAGDDGVGEQGDVPLRYELMVNESTEDSSACVGQPYVEVSPVGPVGAGRPTSPPGLRRPLSLHPMVGEGARSKRPVGPRTLQLDQNEDGTSSCLVAAPSIDDSATGVVEGRSLVVVDGVSPLAQNRESCSTEVVKGGDPAGFLCPECSRGFATKVGVSLHRRAKHFSEYNAEIDISRVKARWSKEEQFLMARREAQLTQAGQSANMNQKLRDSVAAGRTLEAIKSHRRREDYRKLVREALRVGTGKELAGASLKKR
ncbi:unnamed protein product [Ixodes pacificus]